jgi:hypothetical protein
MKFLFSGIFGLSLFFTPLTSLGNPAFFQVASASDIKCNDYFIDGKWSKVISECSNALNYYENTPLDDEIQTIDDYNLFTLANALDNFQIALAYQSLNKENIATKYAELSFYDVELMVNNYRDAETPAISSSGKVVFTEAVNLSEEILKYFPNLSY